jgi:hypothetical protein
MDYQESMAILDAIERIWTSFRDGPPSAVREHLEAETNLAQLPWHKEIVGYGIGPVRRANSSRICDGLRLYVRPGAFLLSREPKIPERVRLRRLGQSLPVEVIEQQPVRAQTAVKPGDVAAHTSGPEGILGVGVLSQDGAPLLLSCAHVFAPRDHMAPGPLKDNIIEGRPGPPSPAVRLGTLQDVTAFGDSNTIDAATCAPDPGTTFPIASIAAETLSGVWDPTVNTGPLSGRKVWRLDQTGARVEGEIVGVDAQSVNFLDGFPDVSFHGIISYLAPNAGGDSGGAVVETLTGHLMGLHFAGEGGSQSYFCLASLIFKTLNIKFQ